MYAKTALTAASKPLEILQLKPASQQRSIAVFNPTHMTTIWELRKSNTGGQRQKTLVHNAQVNASKCLAHSRITTRQRWGENMSSRFPLSLRILWSGSCNMTYSSYLRDVHHSFWNMSKPFTFADFCKVLKPVKTQMSICSKAQSPKPSKTKSIHWTAGVGLSPRGVQWPH